MNLRSIEYFIITAEEMNFTRAADRLFISQQALSSHIKRLETEYNVQLFERRPSLHLTPEGTQMLFHAKQILNNEAKMRAAFSDISINCRGTLKIGMSRLRSAVFFPRIWNYYHSTHPNISIEIIDGSSSKLETLLQSGDIDFYIGIDVAKLPNQQNIELAHEKIHCCIAKTLLDHYAPKRQNELLLQWKNGIDLSQIIDFPLISVRKKNRIRNNLDLYFSHQNKLPNYILECDQQDIIYNLAKTGVGVGILSPVLIYQNIKEIKSLEENLYSFSVNNAIPDSIVSLVYRNDYPLPRYALDAIQIICMVFRNYTNTLCKEGEENISF